MNLPAYYWHAAGHHPSVTDLFNCLLLVPGHKASDIIPMFKTALITATKSWPSPVITTGVFETTPPFFFNLLFHPRNVPSSKIIQAAFSSTLLYPRIEPQLFGLHNFENDIFRSHHLIIAYHRPYTLWNVLFPRIFKASEDPPVSSLLPPLP